MVLLARPVNVCPRRLPSLKAAQAPSAAGLRVQTPSLLRGCVSYLERAAPPPRLQNPGPAKGTRRQPAALSWTFFLINVTSDRQTNGKRKTEERHGNGGSPCQ